MIKFKINQWLFEGLSKEARNELTTNGFEPQQAEIELWSVPSFVTAKDYSLIDLHIGEALNIYKLSNIRAMQDYCCKFNSRSGRKIHLNTKLGIVVRLA